MLLFAQAPFSYVLGVSNMSKFRSELVWKKNVPQGFLTANRRPLKIFENILVFGNSVTYNPQMKGIAPKRMAGSGGPGTNYGDTYTRQDKRIAYEQYPLDLIEFDKDAEKIHPTQKPVSLCEYLIKTYSNEGDTVLDNCMGSGSTGVAAVQCGRDFIGIEKDEGYFRLAKERIEQAQYKAKRTSRLEDFI